MTRKSDPNSRQPSEDPASTPIKPQPTSMDLSQPHHIELSGLTESQIQELRVQHASGMMDIARRAEELKVDVGALDALLTSFNTQTQRSTDSGAHTTITHTQTTSVGRTEVVVGNTEKAAKGKLSSSAKGEQDIKLPVIIILAITAIIIAIVVGVR